MERKPVISSNLRSVGYADGTLEVEFKSGAVFQYKNVPEHVYADMMNAASIGSFFSKNVKDSFVSSKVTV